MFGTNGIRGPVGTDVTGRLGLDVGRALGSMTDTVVVGRDVRESGPTLARAAIAGLQETGSDVLWLGTESTPTVVRSVDWFDADAGLVVTASHNPPTDNGFTFWQPDGRAFDTDQRETLTRQIENTSALPVSPREMGAVRRVRDASRRHLERLPDDDLGPLTVVVDLGNGTGQLTVEALLGLGCDVRAINAKQNGTFPGRPIEPTAANCSDLSDAVATSDADFGVAHDGDADRLMAVDETGRFLAGDELFTLFAMETIPSDVTVAAPINTSALLGSIVTELGGEVRRTAVGNGSVADACSNPGVIFGGKPNGTWIWPDQTLVPDGHYAACRLAEIVASGSNLSDRIDSFPRFSTKRVSLPCEDGTAVVAELAPRLRDRYEDVIELDGVRVQVEDGWYLLRPSGTEPLLRIAAEARTDQRAEELLSEARTLVDTVVGSGQSDYNEPPVA